ncbi:hypothetical protein WR25_14459 [Diploscapter pachys]|uniref:Uncharacterized protein n=1 Tax=Diploscapter pachys TaxID=2018661 RepID=A0A2A2LCZ5_9BILA|nr:hypothetical protein WR25_14459 [Diploscapter pachys]
MSFVSNGHLHPVQLDLAADRAGVCVEASRFQLEIMLIFTLAEELSVPFLASISVWPIVLPICASIRS